MSPDQQPKIKTLIKNLLMILFCFVYSEIV